MANVRRGLSLILVVFGLALILGSTTSLAVVPSTNPASGVSVELRPDVSCNVYSCTTLPTLPFQSSIYGVTDANGQVAFAFPSFTYGSGFTWYNCPGQTPNQLIQVTFGPNLNLFVNFQQVGGLTLGSITYHCPAPGNLFNDIVLPAPVPPVTTKIQRLLVNGVPDDAGTYFLVVTLAGSPTSTTTAYVTSYATLSTTITLTYNNIVSSTLTPITSTATVTYTVPTATVTAPASTSTSTVTTTSVVTQTQTSSGTVVISTVTAPASTSTVTTILPPSTTTSTYTKIVSGNPVSVTQPVVSTRTPPSVATPILMQILGVFSVAFGGLLYVKSGRRR